MAEIEHFVDPQDKSHRKFSRIEDVEVLLYSASSQASGQPPEKMKIGQAVKNKIINNETLGYFIARIHLFLTRCGISKDKLRFRQHMPNEMAHYACDCWDAECHTTYGWIECVGCADRSCYDLTQHAKHSGARLVAERKLAQPKMIDVVEAHLNTSSTLSKKLNRKDTKQITAYLDKLNAEEIVRLENRIKSLGDDEEIEIEIDDKKKKVKKCLLAIKRYQKPVSVEEIVPSVIEPSFGIGRIMYAIWEHTYKERDANRSYFSLPAIIAPYKCSILQLNTNNDAFKPLINELSLMLTNAGISHKIDDNSGSIGRRYARTDEIAIPFGITIDFDSLNDASVTLRERDSTEQIRIQMKDVVNLISDLVNLKMTWPQVLEKYPTPNRSSTSSNE